MKLKKWRRLRFLSHYISIFSYPDLIEKCRVCKIVFCYHFIVQDNVHCSILDILKLFLEKENRKNIPGYIKKLEIMQKF